MNHTFAAMELQYETDFRLGPSTYLTASSRDSAHSPHPYRALRRLQPANVKQAASLQRDYHRLSDEQATPYQVVSPWPLRIIQRWPSGLASITADRPAGYLAILQ